MTIKEIRTRNNRTIKKIINKRDYLTLLEVKDC